MRHLELLECQIAARQPAFGRKVDWTRQLLLDALEKMEHPYIAFSGGIDSTVLLDLLFEASRSIEVLWGDDGYDYPATLAFLAETEQRYGFRLHRIRCLAPWSDWCQEMDRPDLVAPPVTNEINEAWGNPRVWDDTWDSLKDSVAHGYDGVFLGLLAAESRGRRYALSGGTRPLYQVKGEQGMWHCSPLAAWTKHEVWAYVATRSLPYNPVYDRLATLGVPLEQRRVAPLTCLRVTQYGSHAVLKAGWEELWNQLAATFPRVRTLC